MKFIVPYYLILYKSFAKKLKHRVLKVSVVAYDKLLYLNAPHKAKLKITACPVAIRVIISNSNTRAAMCRT